jgi:hypothetical protein
MFSEAVKVYMANSKEISFNSSIANTFSLITVLFEDLFEAITIRKEACGKKMDSKPTISSLNKTNTLMNMTLT